MTTRRDLLRAFGAATAAALLPRHHAWALSSADASRSSLSGIGVQLYIVRDAMRADLEGTIARLAGLGFTEIEWWNRWSQPPEQIRSILDRHGMRAPAWHIEPRDLEPVNLESTVATALAMGHSHVIVSWLPPAQRSGAEFSKVVDLMNAAGASLRTRGLRVGYHNQEYDFVPDAQGRMSWTRMLAESDPSLIDIELDCYWAFRGGHDPVALLRAHADRITHLHLKDSGPAPTYEMRDVGDGVIDWRSLLAEGTAHRVQHAFVEHDNPADSWASVSAGRRYLRTLGY